MNTVYVHEFVVLADTLNYMEAADQLFLTQSTLSKHIQALEKSLDITLFDRTTRRVQLSEAGSVFLPYARELDSVQAQCLTALDRYRQDRSLRLSLGSIPIMSQYRISELLSDFRRAHPEITLRIAEEDSQDLISLLHRGQCQLAFLRTDPEYAPLPEEFTAIRISEDRLAALVSNDHPLAGKDSVPLAELAAEDFLLFQEHSQMHGFSVHACQRSGFTPRVSFNGRRPENLAELASRGLGVALLMKKQAAALRLEKASLLDLEPAYINEISLCYLTDRPLSPTAKAFLRFIEARFPAEE